MFGVIGRARFQEKPTAPDEPGTKFWEIGDTRESVRRVVWLAICFTILVLAVGISREHQLLAVVGLTGLASALALSHWNRPALAGLVGMGTLLATTSYAVLRSAHGVRSVPVMMLAILLVLAALFFRFSWYLVYAFLVLLVVGITGWREVTAATPSTANPANAATVVIVELLFAVGAIGAALPVRRLQRNMARLRRTSEQLQTVNLALQSSENRFRSLIDLAADAIFVAGPDGTIVQANQQACVLTGSDVGRIIGRPILKLFLREREGSAPLQMEKLRTNARGFQAVMDCGDGRERPVELSSRAMPDGSIQIICRDITERLEADERMLQSQKLESVGRLAGSVAHDFNNLLTVINGYSEMTLQELPSGAAVYPMIEQIYSAGQKGAHLTSQLLAFSRKQVVRSVTVDLNQVVEEHLELLRPVMREDIRIVTKLAPEIAMVLADPGRLHQMLMNLTLNARDAMPQGGELRIATDRVEILESPPAGSYAPVPGSYSRLSVADTGVGMSAAVRGHIFEPFFTTKAKGEGTGLGLSTVYGIVRQLGGTVTVESELGSGTIFRIYLPSHIGAAAAEIHRPQAAESSVGGETVLVAEDDPGVGTLLKDLLTSLGYPLIMTTSGEQAMQAARAHGSQIRLLLTDVVMPGMNGKQLADRIRSIAPEIKVLFMSGYPDEVILSRGVLAEETHYLPKPFTREELSAKVREALAEG